MFALARRPGLAAGWSVAALAAILLAGCAVGGGGSPGGDSQRQGTDGATGAKFTASAGAPLLPLYAYAQSNAQIATMEEAANILVARCMAKHGFADPHQLFIPPSPPQMYRRYGITDLAAAKRWGYQMPPEFSSAPPPLPAGDDTAAFNRALLGPGGTSGVIARAKSGGKPQGCLPAAYAAVGQPQAASPLFLRLDDEAFNGAQTEPTVVKAIAAWSTCMASKGYNFANPYDAAKAFAMDKAGARASAAEIETAVTDVHCKVQTHLVEIWFAAEKQLDEAEIQQNFGALTALRAGYERTQQLALKVIGTGGNSTG